MSIRKTKKMIKKSNHFFTLSLREMGFYTINEWDSLSYSKRGIIHEIRGVIRNDVDIPYTSIKRIIIEHA